MRSVVKKTDQSCSHSALSLKRHCALGGGPPSSPCPFREHRGAPPGSISGAAGTPHHSPLPTFRSCLPVLRKAGACRLDSSFCPRLTCGPFLLLPSPSGGPFLRLKRTACTFDCCPESTSATCSWQLDTLWGHRMPPPHLSPGCPAPYLHPPDLSLQRPEVGRPLPLLTKSSRKRWSTTHIDFLRHLRPDSGGSSAARLPHSLAAPADDVPTFGPGV